ncbi:MAG: tRNA (N(6)-L-threonylcarbamoyladenosine(37)-C(2))-methylthiotransferase MtaB, partial [Flavobacteriales bacterium]
MNHVKKVSFYTLGCKLNFSESSTLARSFEKEGYARVELDDSPDVVVINTCSVTDHADKKCRNLVNRARRANPNAFVAVIGCYAQLKPEEIASIPGVNLVLGANEKFDLLSYVNTPAHSNNVRVENKEIKQANQFYPAFSFGDRTRSFLKVQDGCDYFCSFCTIPLARGFSRSASIEKTMEQAREAASTGVKEVVLTGVNIGDFGKQHNETFFSLIKELDTIEGIERFRISSIEPNLLSDEIIRFVSASKKFVPHFHIPLQSGSDKLLALMRRRYKRELYTNRVNLIKTLMPHACIGVDVITGFPGETEEDFMDTYTFLNELNVSYFHVFTYSERDNTTAVRLPNVVAEKIRQERTKMLRILSEKKKRAFYQSQTNKEHLVLFESEDEDGHLYGFTSNYVKVRF